jgi:hypothetical protein
MNRLTRPRPGDSMTVYGWSAYTFKVEKVFKNSRNETCYTGHFFHEPKKEYTVIYHPNAKIIT